MLLSLSDHVCKLNKQTGEVLFNDKVILLRPKTFELLCLFASNPNAIHSKSEILASVWQGSVVEDQVIFQSINEIRKELGISEAIKTYPRRGYKLEIAISIIDDNAIKPITTNESKVNKKNKRILPFALALLVTLVLSITFFTTNKNHSTPPNNEIAKLSVSNGKELAHKGILVLPFNVSSLSESQQWLRYGAMEGLIKRISPNKDITVFHLEDAIEILNRISLDERDEIDQIFAKSGASYILQTSLSGQPGELNVVYNIYTRTSRTTKTVQAISLEHLLTSLVNIFEQSIDKVLTSEFSAFDQQLQNSLIAKAMQFLEVNDLVSALSFVESAVINEANNVIASYLLVKIHMELNQINEGMIAVDRALANPNKKSLSEYEHRLLFFKGAGLAALGKLTQARDTLLKSQKLSKKSKDWLYFAYNQSTLAKIKLAQNDYQEAYPLFQSALEYQELLNCPMGIAQGYLDFADYYLKTGDISLAQQNFSKAQTLVQEKNLNQVLPLLSEMKQSLQSVK